MKICKHVLSTRDLFVLLQRFLHCLAPPCFHLKVKFVPHGRCKFSLTAGGRVRRESSSRTRRRTDSDELSVNKGTLNRGAGRGLLPPFAFARPITHAAHSVRSIQGPSPLSSWWPKSIRLYITPFLSALDGLVVLPLNS